MDSVARITWVGAFRRVGFRLLDCPTVPFLPSAGTVKIRHSCIALESNQRPPRYEQGALAY